MASQKAAKVVLKGSSWVSAYIKTTNRKRNSHTVTRWDKCNGMFKKIPKIISVLISWFFEKIYNITNSV